MTRFGRDENRGQVLILIGVVVAIAVITSTIALTMNIQASIDRAEGVSHTPTPATDMMTDIDDGVSDSIVTANRNDNPNIDTEDHAEDLIDRQGELFDRVSSYRGHTATVEVNETVAGTRLYNESTQTTLPEGTYLAGHSESLSGGIELNSEEVTDDVDNRTHIQTTTHDIYLHAPDDNTIQADVEYDDGGSRQTDTYVTNSFDPYVDLGEGSFDGYQFRSYDQTEIETVSVDNPNQTQGSVELVVEGNAGTPNPDLQEDSDAVFGVIYTATVQSDRQETTMTRLATHGPARGESI